MVSLTLIKLVFIPWEEPLCHGNNAHVAGMVAMVPAPSKSICPVVQWSPWVGEPADGHPPSPTILARFSIWNPFCLPYGFAGLKVASPLRLLHFAIVENFKLCPITMPSRNPGKPRRQVCRLVAVLFYSPMLTIGLELWASGKTVYNRGRRRRRIFCWRPKTLIGGAPK